MGHALGIRLISDAAAVHRNAWKFSAWTAMARAGVNGRLRNDPGRPWKRPIRAEGVTDYCAHRESAANAPAELRAGISQQLVRTMAACRARAGG